MSAKVKQERRATYRNGGVPIPKKQEPATVEEKPRPAPAPIAAVPVKKLYINIRNPDDHASLLSLKSACKEHPGVTEVVLVLGTEKKSAIRLPFKVDETSPLMGKLVKALGEDAVVLK